MFRNRFKDATAAVESKMENSVNDHKYAIEDSEKMAKEFRGKIATGLASLKGMEKQAATHATEAKKYGRIAEMAVEAGNDADAESALNKQTSAEGQHKALKAQITAMRKDIDTQRSRLDKINTQISQAKSSHAISALRHEGAKARKAFVEATSDFGDDDNPLKALEALNAKTDAIEAEAEAMEELSGVNEESLEDKYAEKPAASSDRLAALKAKMAKKVA